MPFPTINALTRFGEELEILHFAQYPDNDLSQPADFNVFVLLDKLQELVITSPLTSPVPYGYLIYQDLHGEFINMLGSLNIYFTVEINRYEDGAGSMSKSPALSPTDKIFHRFYVTKVDILSNELDRNLLRIEFRSLNELLLNQNIPNGYSTFTEKPYTKNLQEILQALVNAADPQTVAIQNLKIQWPEGYSSNTNLSYASTANGSIMDGIDYCLDWGFSGKDGLTFITADLTTGNLIFWSQFFSQYKVLQQQTTTPLALSDSASETVRHTGAVATKNKSAQMERILCTNIVLKSFKGSNLIFEGLSPLTEQIFDFEKGVWTTTTTDVENLTMFTSKQEQQNDTFVPKLKPWTPKGLTTANLNYSATYTLANGEPRLREKFLPIFLENNVLEVTLPGHLTRQAGDLFILIADSSAETLKTVNAITGPWTVLQVTHHFRPNEFTDKLILGRNEKITDSSVVSLSSNSLKS